MIEVICFVFLAIVLFAMFLTMLSERKTSTKTSGVYLTAIFVIFIVFSFVFKPKNFIRWDLIEHFRLVDNIRAGGLEYVINESLYKDLFVYNYFAYFISLLPEQLKNLLTTIPLIIDFTIVGYIYRKIFKTYLPETDTRVRILAVLMWLSTFGIKLAISGIRCSFAVALTTFAIFLITTKKKRNPLIIVAAILLCVVAVFVHNFTLIIILVWLASKTLKPIPTILAAVGVSFAIEPIARFVVNNINNAYLQFSFRRILQTFELRSFASALSSFSGSTMLIYLCFIALSVYLFAISIYSKQINSEDKFQKTIANFTATVGAVAIGLSFNYLYLERFMYLVSYCYLMIIPIYCGKKKSTIGWDSIIVLPISFFVFLFNDIYPYMVNFMGKYFLAIG